ncbi:MAG TPA: outer membrane beta-barrel protein [Candidatus Binatia bacterium]|nr:outer membrane beta-barrel protein [Candidatus Binatia bacterium]
MNRFLIRTCALAFVLFAIGSANAADEDFKGFYVGANVGGAFGRPRVDTAPSFSPTGYFASSSTPAITSASNQTIDTNGFTAGGTAGYNFQWESVVVGLEADYGVMNLSGSTTTGPIQYPCCPPTPTSPNNFTVTQTAKTSWVLTLRPRIGVVFGHFLLYGTAGTAITNVKYTGLFTDTFAAAHETAAIDETRPGWTAGAGGEYHLSHHLSIKGEYLWTDFGVASIPTSGLTAFTPPIAFPTNIFTHTVNMRASLVRAGLNFRF